MTHSRWPNRQRCEGDRRLAAGSRSLTGQTRSLAERNCLPKSCHSPRSRDPGRAQRKSPAQGALLMIDLTSKLNRVGNRVQASLSDARPFLSSRNATTCLHLRAQLLVERRRCPRVMPKREADQNRDRQTCDRPNHCERGFLMSD